MKYSVITVVSLAFGVTSNSIGGLWVMSRQGNMPFNKEASILLRMYFETKLLGMMMQLENLFPASSEKARHLNSKNFRAVNFWRGKFFFHFTSFYGVVVSKTRLGFAGSKSRVIFMLWTLLLAIKHRHIEAHWMTAGVVGRDGQRRKSKEIIKTISLLMAATAKDCMWHIFVLI